ncbi:MAG: glycine--tRNA ligase subunit beta, partial [Chlamydiota bacterium]|nr:glycine--tRNA ligase subunit beta [Chlamydiota bacterium]
FQSMANLSLSPPTVELAYGLERLAMMLQGVQSIFDIAWNEALCYRDLFLQNEKEWSQYQFRASRPDNLLTQFSLSCQEADRLVGEALTLPAYQAGLEASHLFNLMEARGMISVTERAGHIQRLRQINQKIGKAHLNSLPPPPSHPPSAPMRRGAPEITGEKESLLIEIGTEEIPPDLASLGQQLMEKAMKKFLQHHRISYDQLTVESTPRRLVVMIDTMSTVTSAITLSHRGPPLSLLFDGKGSLSPQGQGFVASKGAPHTLSEKALKRGDVSPFRVEKIKNKEHVIWEEEKAPKSTAQLLMDHFPELLLGLPFPKKMAWDEGPLRYPRPIRWVVALFGSTLLPLEIGAIQAGRISRGHHQRSPGDVPIPHATSYIERMRSAQVKVSIAERRSSLSQQKESWEKKLGLEAISWEELLPQLLFLSEWPEMVAGSFSSSFLETPHPILISEMVEHQKYLPLVQSDGRLSSSFLMTQDQKHHDQIIRGNEHVLAARLSDGTFLYHEERSQPLNTFLERLKSLTFAKGLGSMADKTQRIVRLTEYLSQNLSPVSQEIASAGAKLAKCDLTSSLVQEFPHLQGVIGTLYAQEQGIPFEVARVIEEHWLPCGESSPLPRNAASALVALADKADTLTGCFAVGMTPSSSGDPYALRRQVMGILRILLHHGWSLDIQDLITYAQQQLPPSARQPINKLLPYVQQRIDALFIERGYSQNMIDAIQGEGRRNPVDLGFRLHALAIAQKEGRLAVLRQAA